VESTIIYPAVQEAVKASTAQYNAEELITQRATVKLQIENNLRERLASRGVFVESLAITNFQFSSEFSKAIESKQVAQQDALRSERILEKVRIEADQAKAQAEGIANATLTNAIAEAEAIRIQGKALQENAGVIQLRAIEKWDGRLPNFMANDNMPFIMNMKDMG
jgi:regulator of protease activity HflC (stomatin/prohibitin superfamily)